MPIADQPTPHQKTLSRYFAIGCALIIGVSLSFFLYSYTDNLGNTKLRIEFESRARGYSNAVRNTLNEYLGISHFLKDYIVFNRDLNRQQFKQFANSVLHRYPGVQALSWNPLVKRNSRSIYENNARLEGFKEFSFTERSNTGTLVPTEEREEYVVVYFIEPLEKNKPALGYDIASNSIRRKAIASAFDTGKPIATARIKLVQETGHQFGTLILNPIYYDISPLDTVEERRSSRKGLAVEVLRIGDAIETGLTGFTEEDLTLYLFDVTSNNEIAFLYTRPRTASNTSELPTNTHSLEKGLHLKTKINFGGRQWKFIVVPTNEFIESQKSKASWVVLFVGLCLTIVTMMYLSNRLKHITEIELRVQRETAAKERLSKEIRERKNAQETSARYGKILEQSLNEIYIINEHSYNFVVVNKGARKNLGYSIDELKKLTPIDIKPEYTIESFAKLITPLRNREKDIVLFHTVHKRKDGSLYNVEVHLQLMKFESESVFVAIINDITEKLKTEEELRQSHKMESIGTLAGGIAHDFNNVLSSIIGFTELALEEAVQGSTLEEYLHEVFSAGNRAKDLVWQILTFARQTDEPIKPIDIDNIANGVLKFIRSTIPSTIEIKQHIESESLILGNPTQTHQVILNLCTNAAQAMDEAGGILEVTLKDVTIDRNSLLFKEGLTLGNYIEIKISDTGPGIPSDIISSIFEPYFTTKDPGEGTGMGLAVVQGIIEKNRGKISVESQLGKGTTFKVYLPVTKKRQAQPLYEPERLPTGTESILFVDDEASIANMTTRILESLGYSVTTRTSSVEALELFISKPNSFDLVITDMTMPNLTGDALAVQLMTINPDISVILCTGYSKRISKESAAEIGIKAFAYKPIVKADLAKTVRKILDESKG